jgi:uncharacterized membrane protein YphA (DoxX/SURF4 family)
MKFKGIFTFSRTAIRLVLGVMFILAGVMKLKDPAAFGVIIKAFGILPEAWVATVSIILPLLEVIAGIGLLFDIALSLHTIAILMAVFIAILSYGIHLGLDIDCGCYGPADPESRAFGGLRSALYRDLVMSVGIVFLYIARYLKINHIKSMNSKEQMV